MGRRMKRAFLFFFSLPLTCTHSPTSFKCSYYLNKRPCSIINASKNLFKEPGLTLNRVNTPFPVTTVANCYCNTLSQVHCCKNKMNPTFTLKACLITGVFYMQDLALFFLIGKTTFLWQYLLYMGQIMLFLFYTKTRLNISRYMSSFNLIQHYINTCSGEMTTSLFYLSQMLVLSKRTHQ